MDVLVANIFTKVVHHFRDLLCKSDIIEFIYRACTLAVCLQFSYHKSRQASNSVSNNSNNILNNYEIFSLFKNF